MKQNAHICKITKIKGSEHGARVHVKGRRPNAECQAEAEKAKADPVPFLLRRVGNIPVKWEGGDMPDFAVEQKLRADKGPWGLTGKGRAEIFLEVESRAEPQQVGAKTAKQKMESEALTTGHIKGNRVKWSVAEIIGGSIRQEMIQQSFQKKRTDSDWHGAAVLSAYKVEENIEKALKELRRDVEKKKSRRNP